MSQLSFDDLFAEQAPEPTPDRVTAIAPRLLARDRLYFAPLAPSPAKLTAAYEDWERRCERRHIIRPATRAIVIGRAAGRCEYCGRHVSRSEFHIDHVIPASRGGGSALWNLRASCANCNLHKSAMTLSEWSRDLGFFIVTTRRIACILATRYGGAAYGAWSVALPEPERTWMREIPGNPLVLPPGIHPGDLWGRPEYGTDRTAARRMIAA